MYNSALRRRIAMPPAETGIDVANSSLHHELPLSADLLSRKAVALCCTRADVQSNSGDDMPSSAVAGDGESSRYLLIENSPNDTGEPASGSDRQKYSPHLENA